MSCELSKVRRHRRNHQAHHPASMYSLSFRTYRFCDDASAESTLYPSLIRFPDCLITDPVQTNSSSPPRGSISESPPLPMDGGQLQVSVIDNHVQYGKIRVAYTGRRRYIKYIGRCPETEQPAKPGQLGSVQNATVPGGFHSPAVEVERGRRSAYSRASRRICQRVSESSVETVNMPFHNACVFNMEILEARISQRLANFTGG